METKLELLEAVYLTKNKIAEVTGEEKIDIETLKKSSRFHKEASKMKIYELKETLERLDRRYYEAVNKKELDRQRDAYYATPAGAARHERLQQDIARLGKIWESALDDDVRQIKRKIQQRLGDHWGIISYGPGCLNIGILDSQKTLSGKPEFVFGQTTEIRYEEKEYFSGGERFEMNVGTCGSFQVDNTQIGDRAIFYIGIGQFLGDVQLVRDIKQIMRDSARVQKRYSNELHELETELNDPLKIQQKQQQRNKNIKIG